MIDPTLYPIAWDFYWEFCGPKNNGFGWTYNGATNIQKLHKVLTNSIMLRRLKKDVLPELPEKVISFVPIELTNQKEYDFAERSFISWVSAYKGKNAALRAQNAEAIQKIESLKQIAVKGKLKGVIEWVKDFLESDKKLVIATTHTFVIDALVKAFPGISLKLDGSTSPNKRQEVVDSFQNDPIYKLFITNLKAGGVGITLTAASDELIIELGWNPKIMDQMQDRVHRIGQTRGVNIYYLLALGTIEEKIAELLDKKRKIIDGVIDGIETEQESLLGELMKTYS
jgi:SWI/SNF-related matrix-associated actin-dependent regulator of chromatin subfamily A-like protein 1